MMLFVDGISGGVHCTNVGYWVNDHESAFEILTQLVADEWTLESAAIIEGYERMEVPVEVFDGQPIQVHIQALQRQWQQILAKEPIPTTPQNAGHQLKDWYERLDAYYTEMLAHSEKMIVILKMSKAKLNRQQNEPLRLRLDDQYDSLLDSNRRMHRRTKVDRERNRQRINGLNKGESPPQ